MIFTMERTAKRMIKLVALDVDNTLTNSARSVPEENLAAIRRAQRAGVFVTIATGRGFFGSSSIWKAIGVEGPVINYGGSVINDTRTGKPIYSTSFKPGEINELFALAHELRVHAQLYQGDGIVYEKENPYAVSYYSFLDLPHTVDPDLMKKRWENVPKILYITEPERADKLIPELIERFAGRFKVSGSRPGFIEFNELSAHKGSALAWLASYMGLERSEVAAVGDNLLDLEMIEWAGTGAAVGDASAAIKAAADVVTPSCEDCGVAWFIDEYVLGGKSVG